MKSVALIVFLVCLSKLLYAYIRKGAVAYFFQFLHFIFLNCGSLVFYRYSVDIHFMFCQSPTRVMMRQLKMIILDMLMNIEVTNGGNEGESTKIISSEILSIIRSQKKVVTINATWRNWCSPSFYVEISSNSPSTKRLSPSTRTRPHKNGTYTEWIHTTRHDSSDHSAPQNVLCWDILKLTFDKTTFAIHKSPLSQRNSLPSCSTTHPQKRNPPGGGVMMHVII